MDADIRDIYGCYYRAIRDRRALNLNLVVVGRAFVEGAGEAGGALRTAEEVAASPQDEERQRDRDRDQQTDQHAHEYRGVLLRSRVVQIQAS